MPIIPGEDIQNWAELAKLVHRTREGNWLYRGVTRCDHKLIPTIGRDGARYQRQYESDGEKKLLEEFKRQARLFLPVQPEKELEWMAVAQHHGLPTRLLDWTESVFVAAFFATEGGITADKDDKETFYPVIYGVKDLPQADPDADPFALTGVQIYHPPHISPRIAPQQAVFTVHQEPDQEFDSDQIFRWELKIDGTKDIKLALDRSGYTRARLFPGIDGLADALKWKYKWDIL